jgi:hypothetical protein
LITHSDDGPELEPDDPLAVILRPPSDHLGPPAGRYEAIRRRASRRRLLRATAGAALTCGVAALIVLPLRWSAPEAPATPTVPLAPPPATSPSTVPTPTATPEPVRPSPSMAPRTTAPSSGPPVSTPTRARSATPAQPSVERSVEPSAVRTGARPTSASSTRP